MYISFFYFSGIFYLYKFVCKKKKKETKYNDMHSVRAMILPIAKETNTD